MICLPNLPILLLPLTNMISMSPLMTQGNLHIDTTCFVSAYRHRPKSSPDYLHIDLNGVIDSDLSSK